MSVRLVSRGVAGWLLSVSVLARPGYFKLASLVQYVPLPVRPRTRPYVVIFLCRPTYPCAKLPSCALASTAVVALCLAGAGGEPRPRAPAEATG
jgi:hypothetical protein